MSDRPLGPVSNQLSPLTAPGRNSVPGVPCRLVGGRCGVWSVTGLFLLLSLTSAARGGETLVERVVVGLSGASRMGHWSTVRVRITPGGPPRELALRVAMTDADDQWAWTRGPVRSMAADGSGVLEAPLRIGRPESGLRLEVVDATGAVLEGRTIGLAGSAVATDTAVVAQSPWRHDVPVWATVGGPAGLSGAKAAMGGRKILAVEAAELPTLREGYGGIDALILSTGGDAWRGVSESQWAAMGEWVRNGGHLALSVGANATAVGASPLMKWLPIPILEVGQVRQLGRLESYCGAGAAVTFTGAIPRGKLGSFRGATLVDDNDGPLLARAPYGFGMVTLLAVDLDRPPLAGWSGVDDLTPMLLESVVDRTRLQSAAETALKHQGLSDLGSQMATALDQFPQVRRSSYWVVLGQLAVLLLVVGPLDYLLTNRWLRRPMLTWVTLPLWLVLGLAGAGSVAAAYNGQVALVNQWTLIDYDASSRALRGTAWTSIYSPSTARLEIAVKPEPMGGVAIPAGRLTWIAEPEGSPGGLYRGTGLTGGRSAYELTETGEARSPAVPQWSTKAFLAEWSQPVVEGGPWVESQLESSGPTRLSGSITWNLDESLDEFLLVFGGRVYFPQGRQNRLLAFQPWEPTGPQGQQRDLRAFLTGTTGQRVQVAGKREELQFRAEPYNPLDFDPLRLVRMFTFHDVTGGRTYTGMDHRLLRTLELTSQMHVGQAILLGQVKRPGAAVSVDGKAIPFGEAQPGTQQTFIRCLLPVKVYFEEEKPIDKELREKLQRQPAKTGAGS